MVVQGSTEPRRLSTLCVEVYGFPALMVVASFVPIINLLFYSAHGGFGWLFLPFTFPYVLVRLGFAYSRSQRSDRPRISRFAVASVSAYVLLTTPLSWLAAYSINNSLGTSLPWRQFWAMMLLPVSLLALLW